MGVAGDDIGLAVAVDIEHVQEAETSVGAEVPVGVEGPLGGAARVGGRFEPTFGREDVGATVAVDVARADAVAVAFWAYDVLFELAVFRFIPGEWLLGVAKLGQDFVGFAVVIEVDEERELDGRGGFNGRFRPGLV